MGKMNFILEHKGGQYYHSLVYCNEKGKPVNLSHASLGRFVVKVLQYNGEIIQIWPMNPRFPRSWVGCIVAFLPEDKAKFVAETGFGLDDPPEISLN